MLDELLFCSATNKPKNQGYSFLQNLQKFTLAAIYASVNLPRRKSKFTPG